ncbi:MAG: putative photosynthetic complex assembly protein PuhE [Pseudomonadota bacterium]
MIANPWIAALFALFLWWFSTGAILWVVRRADNQSPDGHVMTALLASPVFFAGVVALMASLPDASAGGAWIGFVAALALWGWIELAFLTGLIAGPNRAPCPEGTVGWDRFRRAWGTIAYHELLLVTALVAIALLSRDAVNQTTVLTFAVLFVARVSAKLNLFFGVPKINTEFLPGPMLHLPSHMRIRRLNWVFPGSVTLLTLALGFWLNLAATTGHVQYALLSAITALALLEHWLMILSLPDEKLWRWMIPAATNTKKGAPAPPPSGGYHGL